jgi:hypothetical protein
VETQSITPKGNGSMGEEDDTGINNFFNILNDLANNKKAMTELMG